MPRAPLEPKLRQRLAAVLGTRHTGIRFAVLDHWAAWTVQLLPLPEAIEDPLESRSLVGAAEEAGPGGPSDLVPVADVDHSQRSLQGELLVERRGNPVCPQTPAERHHGIRQPA